MDQLIFDNHKLLIKIKDEYDKLLLENEGLKKHITNLEKQFSVKPSEKKVIIYDDNISEDIVYKFGEGPIRYFENGKYYHGIGINEKEKTAEYHKCFYVYIKERQLPNKHLSLPYKHIDTYNEKTFCFNCEYNKKLNTKRRIKFFYECLGHTVEPVISL